MANHRTSEKSEHLNAHTIKWIALISLLLNTFLVLAIVLVQARVSPAVEGMVERRAERKTSTFDEFPINSDDIVFLGDSITEDGPWGEMFPGISIKNRGTGGATISGVAKRLDQVISGQPRAVFLSIGTNDVARADPSHQWLYTEYDEILRRLKNESPATSVYVQSLLPRGDNLNVAIKDFNAGLEQLCAEAGVPYIDLHPHFASKNGVLMAKLSNDGLHLMGPGYKLWAEILRPIMEDFGVVRL